jgi:hypothetical protein
MKRIVVKLLAFLIVAITCYAFVVPLPPRPEDIFGTWIGHSDTPNDFYRISLTNSGGLLAYSFTGREPLLYKVQKWELGKKSRLTLVVAPLSSNAYPIIVTGSVQLWKLDLEIRGREPAEGWRHNVACYREQLIEDRMRLLRSTMDAWQKQD